MTVAIEQPRRSGRSRRNQVVALLCLLIVATLTIVYWERIEELPRRYFPRNFGVVEPGKIFRSGLIHRDLAEQTMREHGIKQVICLTYDPGKADFDALPAVTKRAGAELLVCQGLDGRGEGDVSQYVIAVAKLKESVDAGRPVLIHCAAGAQRTGAAMVFYRTLVEGRSPAEAKAELLSFGHDPTNPKNANLIPYINQHMRTVANGLVERGVISAVPDPLPQLIPGNAKEQG